MSSYTRLAHFCASFLNAFNDVYHVFLLISCTFESCLWIASELPQLCCECVDSICLAQSQGTLVTWCRTELCKTIKAPRSMWHPLVFTTGQRLLLRPCLLSTVYHLKTMAALLQKHKLCQVRYCLTCIYYVLIVCDSTLRVCDLIYHSPSTHGSHVPSGTMVHLTKWRTLVWTPEANMASGETGYPPSLLGCNRHHILSESAWYRPIWAGVLKPGGRPSYSPEYCVLEYLEPIHYIALGGTGNHGHLQDFLSSVVDQQISRGFCSSDKSHV